MQNLNIDDESFETERQIVFQERKQVVENNPLYRFSEELQRSFWQNHPYSRPVTGTEEEILSLKKKDLKVIYKKYSPDNAILVISGDIEPAQAYKLTQKYYGKISTGEKTPQKPSEPLTKQQTKFTMELPKLNIPRFVRMYRAPSYSTDKQKIYAYIVLEKYLGDGDTSLINRILVEQKELATSASANYNYTPEYGGSFTFVAVPSKNQHINTISEEIDNILQNISHNFTQQDLTKAKRQLLAGLVYLRDNPQKAADIVGFLARAGMTAEDIENYGNNIEAVTLKQIHQAAADLIKSSFVEAVALPEGEKK